LKAFDFKEPNHLPQMIEPISKLLVSKILPDNCVVLDNTPVVFRAGSWTNAHRQLQMLKDQGVTGKIVFINGTHDPITYSNRELHEQLDTIKNYFPTSKIVLLSSRVQHWFDNIPEFIYVPYPLQLGYIHHTFKPRQKRIGCLNRNNTAHRVWLMHNLLKQNLLRSDCDVYSMSFEHIHNKNYTQVAGWLGHSIAPMDIDYEIAKWPASIATHPDDFPNDFTTDHPAWNTAISVVTETESGWMTMITEKTWKAIRSRSCWTAYMADVGYQFLRDVGFEPDFFDRHASFVDINPIVKICKTFDTETVALDYYHSQTDKINHNFEWSGGNSQYAVKNFTAPWAQKFLLKFQRDLARL
jgi:hypothetical protein